MVLHNTYWPIYNTIDGGSSVKLSYSTYWLDSNPSIPHDLIKIYILHKPTMIQFYIQVLTDYVICYMNMDILQYIFNVSTCKTFSISHLIIDL